MSSRRHYPKAPITEAIIDLQVTPFPEEKLSALQELHAKERSVYPQQSGIFETVGLMQIQPEGLATASAQHRQTGYKHIDKDGRNVWQARLNGFTFSRLAPYDKWETFRDEARRLWAIFRDSLRPERVTRVATRYVNRIDVPNARIDLKDFFRTSPDIAPELPQTLSGFFMQLQVPQVDIQGELLINQTIVPPPREGMVSVVLDIDIFRQAGIPEDDEEIWQLFETLHDRENQIFEASITDRTRELFQ